jgi:hypothetical protein
MNMKHNIKNITHFFSFKKIFWGAWWVYKMAGVTLMTFLIIYFSPLAFHRQFSYVELPNGMFLSRSILHWTGSDDFVLYDKNKRFILLARWADVAWQGDFVFGHGKIVAGDQKGDGFVYKSGWDKPIVYQGLGFIYLEKYNLSGSIEYGPELFKSKAYEQCREDHGLSYCKFKMLNQYWWDVEDGKIESHQCEGRSSENRCRTYSLYKNYVTLAGLDRYWRHWREWYE